MLDDTVFGVLILGEGDEVRISIPRACLIMDIIKFAEHLIEAAREDERMAVEDGDEAGAIMEQNLQIALKGFIENPKEIISHPRVSFFLRQALRPLVVTEHNIAEYIMELIKIGKPSDSEVTDFVLVASDPPVLMGNRKIREAINFAGEYCKAYLLNPLE